MEIRDVKTDKNKICELTLCEKTEDAEFHKNSCLERKCISCRTDIIDTHYAKLIEKSKEDTKSIEYHKWEYISVQKEDDRTKRIISCVSKTSTFENFLLELKDDLQDYCMHKFRATWQHQQMSKYIEVMPENSVMMVMDFSENYKCSFQNEVQSAFFYQNLVTIHPCMVYYRNTIDNRSFLVKHSIIGVSNDLKHDSHLVNIFENKILNRVKEHLPGLNDIVQFTDGCAAQYKGKQSFGYLSQGSIRTERNFFETSHGKNVCDGLGAIVKTSCYHAMLCGKVIANPEDVFDHCKQVLARNITVNEKESTVSLREFIYVNRSEVNRKEITEIKTLVGTRKVHSIQSTGSNFIVKSRNLSCLCNGCLNSTDCVWKEYVCDWTVTNLNPNTPETERQTPKIMKREKKNKKTTDSNESNKSKDLQSTLREKVLQLPENSYVKITIPHGKTGSKSFLAKVTEVDKESEELQVSYMEEKNGAYLWPENEVFYWEKVSSVTEVLGQPTFSKNSTNRRNLYTFE